MGGSFKLRYFADLCINPFFESESYFLSGNTSLDTFKINMVFFARFGTKNTSQAEPGGKI